MKRSSFFTAISLTINLLALTGCAVIDSTSLESAVPLQPGKVKVITYLGAGLDQNRMVYTPGLAEDEDNQTTGNTQASLGLKLGLGITQGLEIDISALANSSDLGKVSVKMLVIQDSTKAFSIMPGIYRYSGEGPLEFNPGGPEYIFRGKYKSTGAELPFLFTVSNSKNTSATFCAKIGYNHLDYSRKDNAGIIIDDGYYDSIYTGLLATFRLKVWKFVFLPEIGAYAYPVKRGVFTIQPVLNFGLGMDFND